ncbi:MFS transporter [Ruania zhangjianzhongii]|uniref:MFS transporter n=1 Tax=Ruania zhangjianzhongii TaxID=2603206 RepID=UPI00143DA99C|nr:MFS transporter [Ruania zhangjianzhongii]
MSTINHRSGDSGYAVGTPAPAPEEPPVNKRGRGRAVTALGFSQAVDNSESGLINTFFPLIRDAFSLNYSALGVLSSLSMFARMLFGPIWAMAADRYGRKKVLIIVTGGWGLWTIAAGFAPNYPLLVTLYAISVIGTVASEPILNGLLPDLFRKSERGKAYGLVRGIGGGVGIVVGPVIGQFGADPDGWRYAMWAMGAISVLSGLLIWMWVHEVQKSASATEEMLTEAGKFRISEAVKLFKIPTVAMIAVMLPLVTSLILLRFYSTFVVDERGFNVVTASYVMAVFSVGAMISAVVGGRLGDFFSRRFGSKGRVMLMQIYLISWSVIVFVTTQINFGSDAMVYVMTFLMGLVFSIGFSGCVLPMVSTVVPAQLGATAFAFLFSLVQGFLTAVITLVIGRVADALGLETTMLYLVVLPYALNAVLWFAFYRIYPRDVERQDARTDQFARTGTL